MNYRWVIIFLAAWVVVEFVIARLRLARYRKERDRKNDKALKDRLYD